MSEDLIKVAVLEQRVLDLKEIVLRVDDAIEKISQVNINLTKMLAVHEEKFDIREKSEESINKKIDNIYDKMEKDHKNVLDEMNKLNGTLEKVEKSLDDRLKKVEDDQANTNLKLAAVAAGIRVLGFVIQNSGFFAKVLSEEEKALTNPTHPAMIEPKAR
jgi:CRISPR/Cas system-associated endonuclease Cas3-HD